jgi:hypothetical protein
MRPGTDELRVAEAIRREAAAVRAPQRLRATLAAQQDRRAARLRGRRGALVAAAVAALAAVVLTVHPGAERGRPSIAGAAAIALLPSLQAAPAADPRSPALLRASVGGVRFPAYAGGGPNWRATGLRRSQYEGRVVVAVAYRHASGARVGYAIVAGAPLPVSPGAQVVARGALRFAVARRAGATIVTWRRGGRTCVLASRDASAPAMIAMAAWHPDGQVPEHY